MAGGRKHLRLGLAAALVVGLALGCKPLPQVAGPGGTSQSDGPTAPFSYRDYIEAVYNRHDPEAIDKYFTPSVKVNSVAPDAEGGSGTAYLKDLAKGLIAAFPDVKVTVDDVVQEKDRLAARVTIEGTHQGEFAGIKPTGRKVKAANFAVYRLENGRIAEVWSLTDVAALLRQLK